MKTNRSPLHPRAAIAFALAVVLSGCTAPPLKNSTLGTSVETVQTLQPGDTLRISFPAAPALDSTQQIRRDGRLNLPTVGEIKAADRTPSDLQAELRRAYSKQLLSGDVTLTVVSSPLTVFVTGAVVRPGKISPDRAITALEAVMEAGGFDPTRANPRSVVIVRTVEQKTQHTRLDLKAALEGRQTEPFYLRSNDIVYVPERFSFF